MTRVLIVDDSVENSYYLATLLRAHGDQVETAQNGVEALAKAHEARPDLVIDQDAGPGPRPEHEVRCGKDPFRGLANALAHQCGRT